MFFLCRCEEVHEMLNMYKEANYLLRVYRKISSKSKIVLLFIVIYNFVITTLFPIVFFNSV